MINIDRIIELAEKQAPFAKEQRWRDKAADLLDQAKRTRKTPSFAKGLALRSLAYSCMGDVNPLNHPVYQEAESL